MNNACLRAHNSDLLNHRQIGNMTLTVSLPLPAEVPNNINTHRVTGAGSSSSLQTRSPAGTPHAAMPLSDHAAALVLILLARNFLSDRNDPTIR